MTGGKPDAWTLYDVPTTVRQRLKFLSKQWKCSVPMVIAQLLRETGWMR